MIWVFPVASHVAIAGAVSPQCVPLPQPQHEHVHSPLIDWPSAFFW